MKWGVRRYQPYPKGKGHKGTFLKSKKRELKSLSDSRNKKLDKRSTTDIKKSSRRLTKENELKRLSSKMSKTGTKKDREQYRRRDQMSDKELNRKVDRLLAKEEFKTQALKANSTAIEIGKKYALKASKVLVPVAAGYALSNVKSEELRDKIASSIQVESKTIDRIFELLVK